MINTTTTSISATIHWIVSTGDRSRPATKYQVICSNVNDDYSLNSTLLDSNNVLYDLKPCALYTCCVGGIDTNGANGAVKCISFRTPFSPIGGKLIFIVSYVVMHYYKLPKLCTLTRIATVIRVNFVRKIFVLEIFV
jgi:hypothetical protein